MIVQTKNGKIKGFEKHSIAGGKKYQCFLGVPYAKPPVGHLRFLAPEPLESWNETYDATHERNPCFQMAGTLGEEPVGSEECLFLNIYTSDINPTSIKPVLFYIHGGGFFFGSADEQMMGADYLINHDVVLVTIQYRLHILGFLNLEIPECPGNAGLKDQVMALKWVKENIKAFGGNPDNITIGGCSAGATSVNLLMISPLSKGLFQKAILQCGTALSTWGLTHEPLKWAFEAAKKLGFSGENELELLNFFRNVPVKQLTEVADQLLSKVIQVHPVRCLYVPFGPSVEMIKENAFLPDFPNNLTKLATPVPCLAGHAQTEIIFRGPYILKNLPNASESMVKEIIKSNFNVTEAQLEHIEKEVIKFYFRENDQQKSNLEKIGELLTDICCFYFYDALELETISKSLYIFYFAHHSENNNLLREFFKQFLPMIEKAFHGEEERFILCSKKLVPQPFDDPDDVKVQKNMCQLWTNFMKSGNPTSENADVWKPHTKEEPYYLQIDPDFKLKEGKIHGKRMKFLKNLLQGIEMHK